MNQLKPFTSLFRACSPAFRLFRVSPALLLCAVTSLASAQVQKVPDKEPQQVFAGEARQIAVTWRNITSEAARAELHTSLYQTTTATAVALGTSLWKKLEILPGQTLVESATLNFPLVKAETKFVIKWVEGTNKVLGTTEVLVYPTNLLSELKTLAGEDPLGIFDPSNQLKPLLESGGVEFSNLEDEGVENYRGKLVIVGPFQNKKQIRENLAEQLRALAAKGVAVVWLQPPPDKMDRLKPSFYTVPGDKGGVVVVQSALIEGLSDNPQAQLNLLYLSKLALHSEPLRLPFLTPQP